MANGRKKPASRANLTTRAIVDYLNYNGWKAWRQNNGSTYDARLGIWRKNPLHQKGIPDILGFNLSNAVFLGVEVKIGKDKLSEEQRDFISVVQKAKGFAIKAKSFDDFLQKLEKHGY